jgi:hypothetical protein
MEKASLIAALVVSLLVVVICIYVCFSTAKKKGRSTGWAILWGLLFSWVAVIIYALLPAKEQPLVGKKEIIPQEKIEPSAYSTKSQSLKSESDFYSQAWDEINDKNKAPDRALWSKAFSISQGDEKKTQSKYIELRVVQLQEQQLNSKAEGNKHEFQPTFSSKVEVHEPKLQPTGKAVGKKVEDSRGDVQPKRSKSRLGGLLGGLLIGGALIAVGYVLAFVGWDETGLDGELYNHTYPALGWILMIGGSAIAILGIIRRK